MKRKPTRKRPNTPGVLRSLVRIIHRQTEAIHLLRLDVQSLKYAGMRKQFMETSALARTLANEAVPNTVYPPPLGALATDRMTNADMERELSEKLALPSLSGGAGLPQEPSDSPRSRNAHGESAEARHMGDINGPDCDPDAP